MTARFAYSKSAAQRRLSDMHLKTPRTEKIEIHEGLRPRSIAFMADDPQYWYVRGNEVAWQLPEGRNVLDQEEVNETIARIATSPFSGELVFQERIPAILGGVALRCATSVFVEYAVGALRSILRDALTPARLVLDSGGTILFEQPHAQDYWLEWAGASLLVHDTPVTQSLPAPLSISLARDVWRANPGEFIEWVADPSNEITYLDIKPLRQAGLVSTARIVKMLSEDHVGLIDGALSGQVVSTVEGEQKGVYVLDAPRYEYMDYLLRNATGALFGSGGIMSHVCTYAMMEGIPCIISRGLYQSSFLGSQLNNIRVFP